MGTGLVKELVLAGAIALGLFVACQPPASPTETPAWMKNEARRPDFDLVQVLSPPSAKAEPLVRALRSELGSDFDVRLSAVTSETSLAELGGLLANVQPQAVVLLDNPTVALYAQWAQRREQPPAAVIVMSSFAERLADKVPNSTGISFQPPAVTSLTELRRLLHTPIRRVGVIHREGFETFITREKRRALREHIELVPAVVSRTPSAREVARALRTLRRQEVHAMWIPNDNTLLSRRLLVDAWLPHLKRSPLPTVVGVSSLVTAKPHFGTFAAVPDLEGLGIQTADLLYDLRASSWLARDHPILPPLSIRSYVDVSRARELGMPRDAEATIDVLVGESRGDR